jgi:hypothetical protein
LERFTWRHDCILKFFAKTFQSLNECKLLVDLPGFESPSIITGDEYRPEYRPLSVSSLGVFDKECHTFVKMLNELGLDNQHEQYCHPIKVLHILL